MVGYDTLSRIYEQMCSYSRAWTYTLNRQATYEWTYSLLSISNAMDYPTHYFMPSIDSFYDERLCQSPTRICSRNVTMEYQCLMYPTMPTLLSHHFLALSALALLRLVKVVLTYTPSPAPTGLSTLYDCIHLITHFLVAISHSQLVCET